MVYVYTTKYTIQRLNILLYEFVACDVNIKFFHYTNSTYLYINFSIFYESYNYIIMKILSLWIYSIC